jgi:PilZ domain
MAMSEPIVERREQPRHRVFKGGRLAFDDGNGVDCTVRNISSAGARVDIVRPVGVPAHFTLHIVSDHFTRRCRPVWRNEQRIGIAFD